MTKIDPTPIRPSRGLWAAVTPSGAIAVETLLKTEAAVKFRVTGCDSLQWPEFAAIGWRIIRVDVIPHEEGKDAE